MAQCSISIPSENQKWWTIIDQVFSHAHAHAVQWPNDQLTAFSVFFLAKDCIYVVIFFFCFESCHSYNGYWVQGYITNWYFYLDTISGEFLRLNGDHLTLELRWYVHHLTPSQCYYLLPLSFLLSLSLLSIYWRMRGKTCID